MVLHIWNTEGIAASLKNNKNGHECLTLQFLKRELHPLKLSLPNSKSTQSNLNNHYK